jgi:TorA maturation chaperone TorD
LTTQAGDRDLQDVARLLRLLGLAWLVEPDAGTLRQWAALPPLAEAAGSAGVEAAALEYAESILQAVPPYASLFLTDDAMLNGAPAERAAERYARYGFEIQPVWRAGPPDHLGLELLFLAWLIERGVPAWSLFLDEQVLTWAPICCLAVERLPDAPLYSAVAALTRMTLLALERQGNRPEARRAGAG